MRIVAVIAVICFVFLSAFRPAYLPEAKKVGVYDRDSVLAEMSSYQIALDSIEQCKQRIPVLVQNEVERHAKQKREYDSLQNTWGPYIRELKKKEIARTEEMVTYYRDGFLNDYTEYRMKPVNEILSRSALDLATKKGYDSVVDKQELNGYLVMNPDAKTINVTAEMIKEVKK